MNYLKALEMAYGISSDEYGEISTEDYIARLQSIVTLEGFGSLHFKNTPIAETVKMGFQTEKGCGEE